MEAAFETHQNLVQDRKKRSAALAAVQEKSGSPVAVLGYSGSVAFGHILLTTWGTIIVWLMS